MALTNKPVFTDQRTKDKIDLHLRDPNDKITEEDIENVQTDVTMGISDGESEALELQVSREADDLLNKKRVEDKRKTDDNNSNSVETPWNMLD